MGVPFKKFNFCWLRLLLVHQMHFTDYWSNQLIMPSHPNLTKKWSEGVPLPPGIGLTTGVHNLVSVVSRIPDILLMVRQRK